MEENFINERVQKKTSIFKRIKSIFKKKSNDSISSNIRNSSKYSRNNSSVKSSLYSRKLSVLKEVIQLERMNEFKKFIEFNKSKIKNHTVYQKLEIFFSYKSTFMQIWKTTFAIYVVLVIYIYFLKHFAIRFEEEEEDNITQKPVYKIYQLSNFLYLIDCLFTIVHLFFPHSTKYRLLTIFILLPLKIIMSIPFKLCSDNKIYISTKFLRIDTLHTVSSKFRKFCKNLIEKFVWNASWSRFLLNLIYVFKYVLIFTLYVHFMACVYSLFDNNPKDLDANTIYIKSLYYIIVTFTTVGYGDSTPKELKSIILILLTMCLGIILLCILSTNVINLFVQMIGISIEDEYNYNLEEFIYNLQRGGKKLMPVCIRETICSYFIIKKKICPDDFYNSNFYINLPSTIKNEVNKIIYRKLFLNYGIFFTNCNQDYILKIFNKLQLRIYQKDKILITFNKHVEKLYFLFVGNILISNQSSQNLFELKKSTIFADWFFHSHIISEFNYSTNSICLCFVLTESDYKDICMDDIDSSREFAVSSYIRYQYYKDINEAYQIENICQDMENKNSINSEPGKTDYNKLKKNIISLEYNMIEFKGVINEKIIDYKEKISEIIEKFKSKQN